MMTSITVVSAIVVTEFCCVELTIIDVRNMNKIYGFEGEVKHKYDDTIMTLFSEVFSWLPLAAVIKDTVNRSSIPWYRLCLIRFYVGRYLWFMGV
jgi:hypothetical protein